MLKKYLFGFLVATYLLSAAGIPIYLHYCGGELEKINYVIKGKSCCGGEEDEDKSDNGCCKDEHLVLKNTADFTFRHSGQAVFVKTFSVLFHLTLPFSIPVQAEANSVAALNQEFPPPRLQNSGLISTSVLRI